MDCTGSHRFLFSFLEDKPRLTSRRVHLRRLYDVLHLSLQRHDMPRARRAWAILARCKEVDWKSLWTLSIRLLDNDAYTTESNTTKIDYLRAVMLQNPDEREKILAELVHLYVLAGRQRDALDELEFCLPSFPYRDNPVLHLYAGLCSLHVVNTQDIDRDMVDRAQIFLERAKALDPGNTVVDSLVVMCLLQTSSHPGGRESEDEDAQNSVEPLQVKRARAY
ncbi:hypothetical protein ID866_1863 [Astraeus odoratus]|nr:hypothetical protein ID866_1863 [Astraeus odoratus]